MRDTVSVLGINVDRCTMAQAEERAWNMTENGGVIYTPNPEIIMAAYRNPGYGAILNRADMVVPDGIGVVIASKMLKKPVPERVAGYDLVCRVLKKAADEGKSVYIFGGKRGVSEQAAEKIKSDYGTKIAGFEHGYHKDTAPVVSDICEKSPDILLVCLGAPYQEKWIDANRRDLPKCLIIGAGGSVDVLAGNTKRAPEFFIKLGLEWFYRLICQPSRFIRMLDLPKFALTVFFKGQRQGGNENA
ncbi:MAG: WecB/TagA/CpsF family glycosyltransferase [Clostridia bacterium]|nr:WecB/TagA/CpsF family glycosyltransferase [Clostridia bacterium]